MPANQRETEKATCKALTVRAWLEGPYTALTRGQFFLLVALSFFQASPTLKSIVAAAPGVGMLLSPAATVLTARLAWSVSHALGGLIALAGGCLIAAGLAPQVEVFALFCVLATALSSTVMPLVTALWRQNIPGKRRGQALAHTNFAGAISAAVCGALAALFLQDEISRFRPALIATGVLLILIGFLCVRIPSHKLPNSGAFSGLRALWQDRLFAYICFAWMIVGIGNLSTRPLRVEYLASGNYSNQIYAAWEVLLLLTILPQLMLISSIKLWGKFFDRLNLILMRQALNGLLFLSIIIFFVPNFWAQIFGMLLFGATNSGGTVIWALWVTRVAPPAKTADYMAAHVFLCGLRAVFGPVLALQLIAGIDLYYVVWANALLVLFSSLLFIPLHKHPRLLK